MPEPFAQGYLSSGGAPCTRIARGLLWAARELPVRVDPDERIAGHNLPRTAIGYDFGGGIYCNHDAARAHTREHPEDGPETERLLAAFREHDCALLHDRAYTDTERRATEVHLMWGGRWGGHTVFGYDELLRDGTAGIRARIEERLAACGDAEKEEYYRALLTTCEAFELYALRFAEEAERMLPGETDPARRENLRHVAANCRALPRSGAADLEQAVQSFWLCAMFDGVDSPGRLDRFLYPYFQKTPREQVLPVLRELWRKFNRVRMWNVCISGVNPDGSDSTNELSYLLLDLAGEYGFKAPNLTMRCHAGTPGRLWRRAAEVLSTGIGMPALYNDDVVIPALRDLGIPHADACNYAMNGCNQIDIQGKSHMGLEDGEVTLLKCLELALHRGVCPVSGARLAPDFGDPPGFQTYGELFEAYRKTVEHAARMAAEAANKSQRIYAQHAPALFRSLFIEGCIEKGLDFKNGGPLYNHGQILTEGIADTADCLAALKYYVYEEKSLSMEQLLREMDGNFTDDALRRRLLACPHRFGNDDGYADGIAAEIITHFFGYLLSLRTFRGGIYGGGCSTFNRAAEYGKTVGAMPDGRRAGESLADSVGACPGRDVKGPTAHVLSAARYDQRLAKSGYVLQLKFDRALFSSPRGMDAFVALARTYFKKGGQQLSVNVLDPDELKAAKREPEKHRNLIVRVGGFSEYFVNLTPELQDNVIRRTAHGL